MGTTFHEMQSCHVTLARLITPSASLLRLSSSPLAHYQGGETCCDRTFRRLLAGKWSFICFISLRQFAIIIHQQAYYLFLPHCSFPPFHISKSYPISSGIVAPYTASVALGTGLSSMLQMRSVSMLRCRNTSASLSLLSSCLSGSGLCPDLQLGCSWRMLGLLPAGSCREVEAMLLRLIFHLSSPSFIMEIRSIK